MVDDAVVAIAATADEGQEGAAAKPSGDERKEAAAHRQWPRHEAAQTQRRLSYIQQ